LYFVCALSDSSPTVIDKKVVQEEMLCSVDFFVRRFKGMMNPLRTWQRCFLREGEYGRYDMQRRELLIFNTNNRGKACHNLKNSDLNEIVGEMKFTKGDVTGLPKKTYAV
jgi:hypothetical protein